MRIADHSTAFPLIPHRPRSRNGSASGRTQTQWHRPWLERLKSFRVDIFGMSLMGSGSAGNQALSKPARVPFAASLCVMPTIAHANTERLLTITAHFPLGRGPTTATAEVVIVDGVRVLEVRFDQPAPDFAISDLVLVPYTVELAYAPVEPGDLPVRMTTGDGFPVGESVIITRATKGDVARI